MMNKRFTVEQVESEHSNDVYYWIRDNQSKRWNMPDRATSLNFGRGSSADKVADLLNTEWANFLRDPR